MRSLLLTSLFFTAISLSASAQTTFTSESFDYPPGSSVHNQSGGSGWANPWWSDNAGASGMDVVSPGFDATGNKGLVVYEDQGAYRKPDGSLAPDLDDGGLLGKDGGVLWISYFAVRPVGCQDQFGGVSLYEQFVGEKLFIGSPWMSGEWGIGVPGVGNFPVAGTSCDVLTNLVARIDFLPGDERVRLYLNPSVPFPLTGEVLDMTVPDFHFNELGLRSGGTSAVGGTFTGGFEFDALGLADGVAVTCNVGTSYCDGSSGNCPGGVVGAADQGCPNSNPNNNGAKLTPTGCASFSADTYGFEITDGALSKPGILIQGSSAISYPTGNNGVIDSGGIFCVAPQLRGFVFFTDATGAASRSTFQGAPFGASAQPVGSTTYNQYWFRDPGNPNANPGPGAEFNFSNGVETNWVP